MNHLQNIIDLSRNENPFGCSPQVLKILSESGVALNHYPEANQQSIRHVLSQHLKVDASNICVGNGSDECILLLLLSFMLNTKNKVLLAEHEYCSYQRQLNFLNIDYHLVKQKQQQTIENIMSAIDDTVAMVLLSNPSNPWGHYYSTSQLKKLLVYAEKFNILVVMDEAYHEFVSADDYHNTINLLARYDNLVLLRSFSKAYGLAGLRLGYIVAENKIISKIDRHRLPYNINNINMMAIQHAIDDQDFVAKTVAHVQHQKQWLYRQLDLLSMAYRETHTNFILLQYDNVSVLADYLLEHGIKVNPLTTYGITCFLRVSIGLVDQNQCFINLIRSFLDEPIKIQ